MSYLKQMKKFAKKIINLMRWFGHRVDSWRKLRYDLGSRTYRLILNYKLISRIMTENNYQRWKCQGQERLNLFSNEYKN